MYDLHPHPINSITQAQPLSMCQTRDAIHPYLHGVNIKHNVFLCGIRAISISSATPTESDANTLPLRPKTSSVDNIASESAASPAAGSASEVVTS